MTPPDSLRPLLDGRPYRAVWRNETGGITWEVPGEFFVKWTPAGNGVDLNEEAVRLRWAQEFTAVPLVLGQGLDDEGSWLQTAALPGESAVSERWKADPVRAVAALGTGLRALHEQLPVDECPFDWSAQTRVARAVTDDPGRRHEEHRGLTAEQALAKVENIPPPDRLVVCHGDACAPNTVIGADGRSAGHVDLGSLGVADRWADLAVATWSTQWNYGPGWEPALLRAYGVAADPERTAYYRLLWDLGP